MFRFRNWQTLKKPPSVVIVGCGFWSIIASNGSATALKEYSMNLTRLVQPFDRLHDRRTKILWVLQELIDMDKNVLGVTNEQIEQYNDAAIEVGT